MKKVIILYTIILLFFTAFSSSYSQVSTLWSEDFEGDWTANWHADFGTWEAGVPTSGPNAAYGGDYCAATVLAGNYSNNISSRFIRHSSFVVPSAITYTPPKA